MQYFMRFLAVLTLATFALVGCNRCGSNVSESSATLDASPESVVENEEKNLVVYFSATGTTKAVAEKIAKVANADLYEIVPAQLYSKEDLDYNDKNSRTSKETDDPNCRPEIASDPIDLAMYSTVYIGYPIWWGEAPRILSAFVENYNFDGIRVVPFCTSGGSELAKSGERLAEQAKTGNWRPGGKFSPDVSEDDLKKWIAEMR